MVKTRGASVTWISRIIGAEWNAWHTAHATPPADENVLAANILYDATMASLLGLLTEHYNRGRYS